MLAQIRVVKIHHLFSKSVLLSWSYQKQPKKEGRVHLKSPEAIKGSWCIAAKEHKILAT